MRFRLKSSRFFRGYQRNVNYEPRARRSRGFDEKRYLYGVYYIICLQCAWRNPYCGQTNRANFLTNLKSSGPLLWEHNCGRTNI